jgi:uncharacterized membrane protein YgcG
MPLVAFAALAVPQLGAAEVRDRAGIFSSEAVQKAEAELDRIERRTHIPVVIETIEALPGLGRDSSASEKRTAVERLAEQRASEIGYEGVYLLISKKDHVISHVLVHKRFKSLVSLEERDEVRGTLAREFKGGRFDEGLLKTTALLESALAEASPVSGIRRAVPGMPAPRRGEAQGGKFGLGTLFAIGLGRVLLADGHGRNAWARNGAGPRLRTRIWWRIWCSPWRFLLGHARRTWRSSRWQLALRPVLGSPRWRRTERCLSVSIRRISRTRGPGRRRIRWR